MAKSSSLASLIPSKAPVRPGEGPNPVVEALMESNRQVLEAGRTAASLQAESMKQETASKKMLFASMRDLATSFATINESNLVVEEADKQRAADKAAASQAQEAAAKQSKAQEAAATARQDSVNEVNRTRNDRQFGLEETFKKAIADAPRQAREYDFNLREYNAAVLRMTTDIPEDDPATPANEAKAYVDTNRKIAIEFAVKLGQGKTAAERRTLEEGLAMSARQKLAQAVSVENDAIQAKQRAQLQKKWEMDTKFKNTAEVKQTQLFGQRKSHELIDKSLEEKLSPQQAAERVMTDLRQTDLSGGQDGVGMIQVLQGSPDNATLNKAASKLGPAGWATTDSLLDTLSGFEQVLGKTDDKKLEDYRKQVLGILLGQTVRLHNTNSYNSMRHGAYLTENVEFWDKFRQDTGRFPTDQEVKNHLRKIDVSWMPGDLDMKKLFPAGEAVELGIPAEEAGPALRTAGTTAPREKTRETGRKMRRGVIQGGKVAASIPMAGGKAMAEGASFTQDFLQGFFGLPSSPAGKPGDAWRRRKKMLGIGE